MKVLAVSARNRTFEINSESLFNTNDIAAAYCFGARSHIPAQSPVEALQDVDVLFCTMSKVRLPNEDRWLKLAYDFKSKWPDRKLILHQEAEKTWMLMRPGPEWPSQLDMMQLLKDKVDLFLVHTQKSRLAYVPFMDKGRIAVWKTVQDLSLLDGKQIQTSQKRKVVGVNTYDGRANGLFALACARRCTKNIIQLNRSDYHDNRIAEAHAHFGIEVKSFPVLPWDEWTAEMAKLYVYVHPMPAESAGRDTIVCAKLGVPVIGSRDLDAQIELFPELAVDPYDSDMIQMHLITLLGDTSGDWYEHLKARAQVDLGHYTIESGIKKADVLMRQLCE